jgi:hypothetical protein
MASNFIVLDYQPIFRIIPDKSRGKIIACIN